MLLDNHIPVIYILKKSRQDLVLVLLIGLFIYYFSNIFMHVLPVMPLPIPAFIGTAISVLLSFKISQSYDRWWEARKVWGAIVNDSRSFVLQLQAFLSDPVHPAIKAMAYRQIGWCYALGRSLRGQAPLEGLEPYFSNEELQELNNSHTNKPLGILQLNVLEIKRLLQKGELEVFTHVQLDATLVRLCDSMGKAERINSTVFPVTYRLLLRGVIYLFVITLSLSLQDVPVVFELPLLVLLSLVFFFLEKTAYHLQDPFRNRPSDTPVTAIARNIEINLKQLLQDPEVPSPAKPNDFYLL